LKSALPRKRAALKKASRPKAASSKLTLSLKNAPLKKAGWLNAHPEKLAGPKVALLKSTWPEKADFSKLALPKAVPQKRASRAKVTPEKEALGMVQLTRAKGSWTWAWGREERSR